MLLMQTGHGSQGSHSVAGWQHWHGWHFGAIAQIADLGRREEGSRRRQWYYWYDIASIAIAHVGVDPARRESVAAVVPSRLPSGALLGPG